MILKNCDNINKNAPIYTCLHLYMSRKFQDFFCLIKKLFQFSFIKIQQTYTHNSTSPIRLISYRSQNILNFYKGNKIKLHMKEKEKEKVQHMFQLYCWYNKNID